MSDIVKHKVNSRADGFGNRSCICGGVWNDSKPYCDNDTVKELEALKVGHTYANPLTRAFNSAVESCIAIVHRHGASGAHKGAGCAAVKDDLFLEMFRFVQAVAISKQGGDWKYTAEALMKKIESTPRDVGEPPIAQRHEAKAVEPKPIEECMRICELKIRKNEDGSYRYSHSGMLPMDDVLMAIKQQGWNAALKSVPKAPAMDEGDILEIIGNALAANHKPTLESDAEYVYRALSERGVITTVSDNN